MPGYIAGPTSTALVLEPPAQNSNMKHKSDVTRDTLDKNMLAWDTHGKNKLT